MFWFGVVGRESFLQVFQFDCTIFLVPFFLFSVSSSLSDLNQPHSQQTSASSIHSSTDMLQIPQGSQFGSQGSPLHTIPSADKIKVELDMTLQQRPGSQSEDMTDTASCSLERLGIVPARSLSKGKFGSLLSLQFSFRSQQQRHPPPPPPPQHLPSPPTPTPLSTPQPVVVKGMRRGCPAAASSLKPGK